MIKLPDKGRCTHREFLRAMKIDHYVYIEFMNYKRSSWDGGDWDSNGERVVRDLTPRPKIFKVVKRNILELNWICDIHGNWKTQKELWDCDYERVHSWAYCGSFTTTNVGHKYRYSLHNIWSWFQQDEVRNIRIMNWNELAEHYMWEFI